MKKEKIIQFVGFITTLEAEAFTPKWKECLRALGPGHPAPRLQEQDPESRNRFKYISQHEWPDQSFDFLLKNGKRAEHFPELNVRVIHAGGYLTLPGNSRRREDSGELKLFAFISHNDNDIAYYQKLSAAPSSIYQAYYESCTHSYILEYSIPRHLYTGLIQELKAKPGVEICLCRTTGSLQPA